MKMKKNHHESILAVQVDPKFLVVFFLLKSSTCTPEYTVCQKGTTRDYKKIINLTENFNIKGSIFSVILLSS